MRSSRVVIDERIYKILCVCSITVKLTKRVAGCHQIFKKIPDSSSSIETRRQPFKGFKLKKKRGVKSEKGGE